MVWSSLYNPMAIPVAASVVHLFWCRRADLTGATAASIALAWALRPSLTHDVALLATSASLITVVAATIGARHGVSRADVTSMGLATLATSVLLPVWLYDGCPSCDPVHIRNGTGASAFCLMIVFGGLALHRPDVGGRRRYYYRAVPLSSADPS
ncbi:MAG: hypothetical protein ACON5B_12095 [Myxococcota bacterium]